MLQEKTYPIIDVKGGWVFYPLPDQKNLIEALRKNKERQRELEKRISETKMNFNEAVEMTKQGIKVRRTTWDKDMWMGWFENPKNGYLIHSHPYWEHQQSATNQGEFIYVNEKDDAFACDWEKICA